MFAFLVARQLLAKSRGCSIFKHSLGSIQPFITPKQGLNELMKEVMTKTLEVDNDQELRSSLMQQMADGRYELDGGYFETSFQIFANALERCKTIPALGPLKYQVLSNLGWANRLAGRYQTAAEYLQEALDLADAAGDSTTMTRAQIESELGTVHRLMGCHELAETAFTRLYSIATVRQQENLSWKRVTCRAIGNLAMASYQRALELDPQDPHIKRKTRYHIEQAITQLKQRIELADEIIGEDTYCGHGSSARINQGYAWWCIAQSRLSLCYTAVSDLDPEEGKTHWLDKAVKAAKEGVDMATPNNRSALPLSRFFYGRALLHSVDGNNTRDSKAKALEQFNSTETPDTATPAIALAMEPSAEHRGYLRELVAAGADMMSLDPNTGYTALDYAVFAGDTEAESIIVDGLREQLLSTTAGGDDKHTLVEAQIEQQRSEARLRKGYREMFQEKLRPILSQSHRRWQDWQYGSENVKATLRRETIAASWLCGYEALNPDKATLGIMFDEFRRRDTILALRRAYADTIAAYREAHGESMFDELRAIRYTDFAKFGRLPRSSDGLVVPLMDVAKSPTASGDEFIIFFSYRWINHDPGANSPDDANHTQYKRMIAAVQSYLAHKETPNIVPERLYIWMDFACVDQDNPAPGVSALPLIIAQCDAVITLHDEDYFDQAWCCVEALLTQALWESYHVHDWFQQIPAARNMKATKKARNTNTSSIPGRGDDDESTVQDWELQYTGQLSRLTLDGTKLTHESDRPKIMFLGRQCGLLRRP